MLLLLLCSDIVDTSLDISNGRIGIRDKQQQNKRLADRKRNNSMEEELIVNIQSGDQTHLPSAVVVAAVLVLLLLLLRWRFF